MKTNHGSLAAICLVVAGLAACSPADDVPDTDQGAASGSEASPAAAASAVNEELEHTGRVVVSGPEGLVMVSLQREDGQSVGLAGDLLDELTRLSGAVVAVAGPAAQTLQGEGVEVVRYEVVSVDGEQPFVGVLAGGGSAFRLQAEESISLVDVPAELAAQVGAKIWVTGPETAEGRRVRSYGVIRPAG